MRRLGGGVAGGVRGGRGLRAGALDGSATPRWATPRACSSRSRWAPSTATWRAAAAPAFALGVGAALLRPEAWPFLGLYGALAAVARARAACASSPAASCCCPLLWLLPELWGSGDLLRAAHRAQTPRADSAAFAQDPARAVLDQFASLLTPAAWVGVAALVAALALGVVRGRADRPAPSCAPSAAWRWARSRGSGSWPT